MLSSSWLFGLPQSEDESTVAPSPTVEIKEIFWLLAHVRLAACIGDDPNKI